MLNYFSNLTPTQWIGIGVGLFLLVISSKDYVLSFIPESDTDTDEIDEDLDITSLVSKWEVLSDACKEAGVTDAYNKLQEVFPLLISVYNDES